MTDSVRCKQDSNNVYTCEVDIDSDFSPGGATSTSTTPAKATPAGPPPPSPPPPTPTSVSTLVERYTTTVSINSGDWARAAVNPRCLSPELGLPLLAAAKGPVLGVIGALKTGLDIAKCICDEAAKALPQRVSEYCAAEGGRIISETEEKAVCEIRSTAK